MMKFILHLMMVLMMCFVEVKEENINYITPKEQYNLKATYYNNTPAQGWGDGQITASGKRLYGKNIDELRYVAMSRDMIRPTKFHKEIHGYNPDAPFQFGDTIVIKGTKTFNGEWIVADAMHERYTKRIDFLISKKTNKKIKFKAHSIVVAEKK